jgi:hypothetical protein
MNTTAARSPGPNTAGVEQWLARRLPVITLLFDNPARVNAAAFASLLVGLLIGWGVYLLFGLPLWLITLIVILALIPAGTLKWRADRERYGATVMVLSIVLVTQGLHTVEHVIQFLQYYVFLLPARQSNGLLSPANSEVVHFLWNWGVLIVVIMLIRGGMRSIWMYLLLAVATAHTFEHSYMFTRFLIVSGDLERLGAVQVTAQGLPGIFGRDGWLARSTLTRGTFLAILPGLTTAMRLDVHFWWNALELTLLLTAAHFYLLPILSGWTRRGTSRREDSRGEQSRQASLSEESIG